MEKYKYGINYSETKINLKKNEESLNQDQLSLPMRRKKDEEF